MARRLGAGVKEMKDAVDGDGSPLAARPEGQAREARSRASSRRQIEAAAPPAAPAPRRCRRRRRGRARRRPRASRPRADGRRQLRRARAVHDQGRLHDPRVPPLAGAVPRRGDARARARRRRATTTRSPRRSTCSSAGGGTMELDGEMREVRGRRRDPDPAGRLARAARRAGRGAVALLLRAAVYRTTTRISRLSDTGDRRIAPPSNVAAALRADPPSGDLREP